MLLADLSLKVWWQLIITLHFQILTRILTCIFWIFFFHLPWTLFCFNILTFTEICNFKLRFPFLYPSSVFFWIFVFFPLSWFKCQNVNDICRLLTGLFVGWKMVMFVHSCSSSHEFVWQLTMKMMAMLMKLMVMQMLMSAAFTASLVFFLTVLVFCSFFFFFWVDI